MSTKPQELNKIIADLRQIIVGKVAMPTDQIEQITLFLFLKQLSKKHDELVRIGSKELIFTGDWERYHFDVLVRHSGEELVKECREAIESLYKNPHIDPTVRKVFERSYLKILDPKVLSSFLQYLNDKFSDGLDLGDFYESLLPILGTQNELGQFRTPRHIIDFIVRVVDPSIGEKIADPACGTAGFLVSAFNYLKEKYTEKGRLTLNPEQIKQLYNDTIYGWDMEPLMVKFSLANLYLHGLKVPNVSENDTLLNENLWQHTFDIIVANPPFITPKGGARYHQRFSIKSSRTEVLFLEWMVLHLNFNGRLGVIVPEGILFTATKAHREVRKLLLDNGVWCIVSLPTEVFQPYTGQPTDILFLDKTIKTDKILFCEVKNHGFTLNTTPEPIDDNDLPDLLSTINTYKEALEQNKQSQVTDNKCFIVKKDLIEKEGSLDLTGNHYRDKKTTNKGQWETIKLGTLCDIMIGGTPSRKRKEYFGGNNTWVTISDLRSKIITNSVENLSDLGVKHSNAKLIKEGTILLSFKLSIGKTAIAGKDLYTNEAIAGLPIKPEYSKKMLNKFLYYVISNYDYDSVLSNRASKGKTMNKGILLTIDIPFPPIDVQEKLVAEVDGEYNTIQKHLTEIESHKKNIKQKLLGF